MASRSNNVQSIKNVESIQELYNNIELTKFYRIHYSFILKALNRFGTRRFTIMLEEPGRYHMAIDPLSPIPKVYIAELEPIFEHRKVNGQSIITATRIAPASFLDAVTILDWENKHQNVPDEDFFSVLDEHRS